MNVIEVRGLVKRYGKRTVVDGISFDVRESEIFAILGPNGSGKTTTVESIAGMRQPDGGSIRVMGMDPRAERDRLRRLLGIQLQESELQDRISVREAMTLYSSFYESPIPWQRLIDDLGLGDRRDTPFRKLSGGQKQRLSVALALVGDPRIAVLDELTTGLDPLARQETWSLIETIRERGVTIVLVTHSMEEAERLADRIAVLDQGRLVALDTPDGIVARAGGEQRIRFRPATPIEDRLLTDLPEVRSLERNGSTITVAGTGDLAHAVTSTLARHHVVANGLRIEQASLGDAYIALTGRRFDD
jgi:ABC-2 type transport system ATP-binding protein